MLPFKNNRSKVKQYYNRASRIWKSRKKKQANQRLKEKKISRNMLKLKSNQSKAKPKWNKPSKIWKRRKKKQANQIPTIKSWKKN